MKRGAAAAMCVWRRARAVGRALVTGRARGALAGERPRRPEEAEGRGVGVWAVLGSGFLQHEGGDMTKWQSESDGFRMQPELGSWVEIAAEMAARERRYESEWARVNGRLRGIAARRAAMDVEEARLLRYAEELKLWQMYGFGSLVEYMERAMGYAPYTASERVRVARAMGELPLIEEALERGELAHSVVRELCRVAVKKTEEAWIEAARGKSLREVEAMVAGRRPGHVADDAMEPRLQRRTITVELSPETYDLWRKMHALAMGEHGQQLSDDELIAAMVRRARGRR